MPVKFGLSRGNGGFKIIVIQGGIDDFMAVILKVGRFDATWDRMPAVKEE